MRYILYLVHIIENDIHKKFSVIIEYNATFDNQFNEQDKKIKQKYMQSD